jgi:pimeloyl-ACP methyl ester carboxylesterase
MHTTSENRVVQVTIGPAQLEGELQVAANASGVVLFAHGSGSSRHSPRNQYVARALRERALGTLLVDLLTMKEEQRDALDNHFSFDIRLLADRLAGIIDWLRREPATEMLPIGLFGASTGGAAALVAASARPAEVRAVVSRGGRPDLAGPVLPLVKAPTLLIVGGHDTPVIELNRQAMAKMRTEVKLAIVPHASHLFEESGALEQVAALAGEWFEHLLPAEQRR